jgi:hypothetical protein
MSDIAELFRTDPLKLTNENISSIVEHFRASRALYHDSGTRTKQETKEPKAPKEKITGLTLGSIKL